ESTDLNEFGNEVTGDVKSDEGFQSADTDAADESGRSESVIGGRKRGDLVVVQLDNGGLNTDGGEKILHDVAHAAGGSGEDDDR
ncbi:hypothetical protein A2U01_0088054, partial [Trifolium medium]|nr:hypothetical protein [Trifolium medium]